MAWSKTFTTAGQSLIASALAQPFCFTRASCGSGTVPEEELEGQTGVAQPFGDAQITDVRPDGSRTVLTVRLDNTWLPEPTRLAQIGLFAAAGGSGETLVLLLQSDSPTTLPTVTPEQPPVTVDFFISIYISSAGKITAAIDYGAFATVGQVAQAVAQEADAREAADGEIRKDVDSALLGTVCLSASRPVGKWKLWLRDGGVTDAPYEAPERLLLETAPYGAPGEFAAVSEDGGQETVTNMTDDPEAAGAGDIIPQSQ
jgi:hypothetical protein